MINGTLKRDINKVVNFINKARASWKQKNFKEKALTAGSGLLLLGTMAITCNDIAYGDKFGSQRKFPRSCKCCYVETDRGERLPIGIYHPVSTNAKSFKIRCYDSPR